MPDAYEVHDAQFIQQEASTSAADALLINIGTIVPAGRVRTILAALGLCSVSETQTYWFSIAAGSVYFPVTYPASRVVTPAVSQCVPCLTEGTELKLFPGERLYLHRAVATAGSTITGVSRFIEVDMQFYVELDKQKVLSRRTRAMMETAPAIGRLGGGGGGGGGFRGGGGGFIPPAR